MSNNTMLFACSKCFSKHPFEELSSGQQLCKAASQPTVRHFITICYHGGSLKHIEMGSPLYLICNEYSIKLLHPSLPDLGKDCRGSFPIVKCTYCRSEFQQTNKLSTTTICNKCEHNVKQFGKPSACEYCNIIAAFIGNKCQRCTNSERKYGPPVTCEQCKQKCAFDRKDDDKKVQVDGKLLCWLCTLSYKRALAKTKQSDAERRSQLKLGSSQRPNKPSRENRPNRSSASKRSSSQRSDVAKLETGLDLLPPVAKAMRTNRPPGDLVDPNSSDHVVAMTQLKEQMASLQKQIVQKDAQLLAKDKMITELKAKHFTNETELRNRMQSTERDFEKKVEVLSIKIKTLQKEVATLTKSNKAKGGPKTVNKDENTVSSGAGSGGSGTDSPLP